MPAPEINLPDEPEENNADSLEIILRMPDSGSRMRRRFLKSDKIELVYHFVDHL